MLVSTGGQLPHQAKVPEAIAAAVLGELQSKPLFEELHGHMFDTAVGDNHVFKLIKSITKCYCEVRFHHLAKLANQQASGPKIRKKLSKLVLFSHQ